MYSLRIMALALWAAASPVALAECRTERFTTGKVREIACLKDEKLHGNQRVYYENGNLRSETIYREGVKQGTERKFYETGLPMQLFEWNGGNRQRELTYYINGKPKQEEKVEGDLTRRTDYHENGKKSSEVTYKTGSPYDGSEEFLEGTARQYGEAGNLLSETSYQAGKRDGIERRYYDNGRLSEKRVYSKGRMVNRTEYDLIGKIILSEEYAEDGTRK